MLEEMKMHHKSLEISSPKFKRITEGSQTALDLINLPLSSFVPVSSPLDLDLKEYSLYAWGLNDSH